LIIIKKGAQEESFEYSTDKEVRQMELEQVYKIKQVAVALSVTNDTVYHMLLDGRLPGVKLGNRWRVRASDVQAFLEANTKHMKTKVSK